MTSRVHPLRAARAARPLVFLAGLVLGQVLLLAPAKAQQPGAGAFVHEQWTTADGLPVNALTRLLQARDGYLWITTRDGLARFDGVRFTVFNRSNTPGLPGNRLLSLIETPDGTLWLHTEQNQFCAFHPGRGQVTVYGEGHGLPGLEVRAIHRDDDGTLLVSTERGLFAWTGDHFEERWRIPAVAREPEDDFRPTFATRDRAAVLWIGLQDGFARLQRERTTTWTQIDGLPVGSVSAMAEDSTGRLWILSRTWPPHLQGRYVTHAFAGVGGAFHPVTLGVPCRREALPAGARLLHDDGTRCLATYAGLYFAGKAPSTYQPAGEWMLLTRPVLDLSGHRWFFFEEYLYRDDGLTMAYPSAVTALLHDHEGSLWVATDGAGLYRLKPVPFETYGRAEGLPVENVYAVLADRHGALWTGWRYRDDGLYRLGPEGGTSYTRGLPSRRITALYEDRSGVLWVGTEQGPCRMRYAPGAVPSGATRPPAAECVPLDPGPRVREPVLSIHEDRRGDFWFGGDQQVLRYRPAVESGGTWTTYTEGFGLAHRHLRAVAEDARGTLWFGGALGGLSAFVPEAGSTSGRFYRLTTAQGLPSDIVRDLHVDDGFLWVATEDAGLVRLDLRHAATPADARIAVIQARHGLPDDALHGIVADSLGAFWISSNRGLFRVDRAALHAFADGHTPRLPVTVYTERDGLRNREFNGGSFPATSRGPDGRLWFPSQAGMVAVAPARNRRNEVPPPVVIEAVRSRNGPVQGRTPLHLQADERSFEIDYTALSFLAPANVHFRYRLEGFDREWVEAGSRRTAYYTRVPPGTYTFHVAASNNDGVWNEAGAVLAVTVAPYAYETTWFYGLCLVLLAGLSAGAYHWRVGQLRRRQHLLEQEVTTRTTQVVEEKRKVEEALATVARQSEQLLALDAAKSRFFTNISHEFRTPLALTIGPLEDLRAGHYGALGSGMAAQMELALRNARRLLRLVGQLLDSARLEAGHLRLHLETADLGAFVEQIAQAFAPAAERKGVVLVVEPAATLVARFDPEQLEKVFINLLSNAFKFTPTGGTIRVTAVQGPGDEAVIAVADDGPGIPSAHHGRLFERFYRVDEPALAGQPGTGIGLALAKELVELHGGRITVASDIGAGSTFSVSLPLEPAGTPVQGDPGPPGPAARYAADATVAASLVVPDAPPGGPEEPDDEADRPSVLVVDDHAELRAYVRGHLGPRYRVVEAADGAEGLDRARALLPDLIVSDVMMPGMDGYAFCRALHQDRALDCIPVILLTAKATLEDRLSGLERGADDYLAKPFAAEELLARIENLLASRRRLKERFSRAALPAPAPSGGRSADDVYLSRVTAAIEAHLSDAAFGVEALADAVGQSRVQLYRRVQALAGVSPVVLIRKTRMERAAHLLESGAGNVGEIAYAVGFNSLSYFARCFREQFGTAPSDFARRADTQPAQP